MTSFKFGRQPAQIPAALHDLTYYAAGPLPAAPASVAVPNVADWGMLSNDTLGSCGAAGIVHDFMAAAADTSEHEAFPTAEQVAKYYLRYDGGQDNGVVLSDFLAYVRKHGFNGHKISAYAPVAVHDVNTLQFAINAYDCAYVGITVTQAMMDEVQRADAGWTWMLAETEGEPIGGHCIILAGYDSQWLYGITWGQVIRIAYPAWHRMSDEAWAVLPAEITKAKADGHGISLAALQADLSKLNR